MRGAKLSSDDWMRDAACIGVPIEHFFPASGRPVSNRVCYNCPVAYDCLLYALVNHERGIWGGYSEAQRNMIKEKDLLIKEGLSLGYYENRYSIELFDDYDESLAV